MKDLIRRLGNNPWCAITAAAFLFFILWRLDYPRPMVDDLYYTGAALNMAGGGDFSNPLIERQAYPSHFFYVYPPFHSFALLGWLKIVGISAYSMTGFQIALYLVIAISCIILLRKYDAPSLMMWLVPLGISTSLPQTGLRPETLAIALTIAGAAVLFPKPGNFYQVFVGLFLIFLGGSAAPRLTMFSAALALYCVYRALSQQPEKRRKIILLVSVCLAFLCSMIVFLVEIHGNVTEFWHTFHTHSSLAGGRRFDLLIRFFNESPIINGAQIPLLWLFIGLLFFAWPKERSEAVWLSLAILGGFFLEIMALGLGAGALFYVLFALLLYGSAVLKGSIQFKTRLAGAFVALFVLANMKIVAVEYQRLRGRVTTDLGAEEKLARDTIPTPRHPVLIDSWTARYLFNYHIPGGMFDIEFSTPFPKSHIILEPRPDDIYLVSPANISVLKDATTLVQPIAQRPLFGLPNRQVVLHPRWVYVIPAEKCQPRGDLPR